jgi:hypothetical protein
MDRLAHDLADIQREHRGATIEEIADVGRRLTVPQVTTGPGWNRTTTNALFVIPQAYPAAQPDCFWAEGDLRLVNGDLPQNSAVQRIGSTDLLWFSWHLTCWHPNSDTLSTYVRFIERRFRDPR